MTDTDAWLAEADDILDNWEGSPDAASWSADGSHETDTTGHYYATDRLAGLAGISIHQAAANIVGFQQAFRSAMRFEQEQRRREVLTVRVHIDVGGFLDGMRRLAAAFRGEPVPPARRTTFDGTAREYRAARRRYARDVRAHRKASR
jgi:hypothetical protein